MAMTGGEAQAVMQVLRWALGDWSGPAWRIPSPEKAREDAIWLADRAHNILKAGLTGADVEAHWPPAPPEPDEGDQIGLLPAVVDVLDGVADGQMTAEEAVERLRVCLAADADEEAGRG